MDGVLLVLIGASFPIATIYLLISHLRLKKTVAKMQERLQQYRDEAKRHAVGEPEAQAASPAPEPDRPQPDETDVTAAPSPWETGPWTRPDRAQLPPSQPTTVSTPAAATSTRAAKRPTGFVFNAENLALIRAWLMRNWFLAVAAISLALAGVFLVQYGVESGFITPFWRVMGAAFLGAALIWFGEFVRRRWGDSAETHTAYLPSTFSGAGLVALFAAVLAARQLYGLIGAEAALVYLVMVSAVAIVLGWYYGPFLAAVGILGAMAAPFMIGGETQSAYLFYYYFAIIAVAALLVDALRRWAWVSAFALILAFGAAGLIWTGGAGAQHFLAFALITAAGAVAAPRLELWPRHDGAMVFSELGALMRRKRSAILFPEFPTRVAAGGFAAAATVALLVALNDRGQADVWLALFTLALLFVAACVWMRHAPALDNLAPLPAIFLVVILVKQGLDHGSLAGVFLAGLEREAGTAPPITVSVLAGFGLVGSALAFWRALWLGRHQMEWAAGAALLAPSVLVVLDIFWMPREVLGEARWAAHAVIGAVMMAGFAGPVARRDGANRHRAALFALSAMTLISFALVIVLSETALTLALAVMVLGAAVIDRRLNMPALTFFATAGAIVIGWRLILDPGIGWASLAPLWELWLGYAGSLVLLGAAWVQLAARARRRTRLAVESSVWAIAGVFASVLLDRALGGAAETHYGFSLMGTVWAILMLVQLYRLQAGGVLRWVRMILAVNNALVAILSFGLAFILANPLTSYEPVIGPPIFDSLLVAFLVPALVFAVGAWKTDRLGGVVRYGLVGVSAAFAMAYVGLEIRRLWHGTDLSGGTVLSGELYSYTIAMLFTSVGVLFYAFSRRSVHLRRIAMIGIALTIAKVFLIDMSGLTGLWRVATFLGLGLSLAGLGWVHRRMDAQWERATR